MLAVLLIAGAQAPLATEVPDPGEYVTRFQSALTAFEDGQFEAAAVLFERAGEQAPDAPVWRVHVAAALIEIDEAAEAQRFAREALRRGYPPSDLAAIDARLVPADVVAADPAPAGTRTVLRLGLDRVFDYGEASIIGDLVVIGGAAWDLMTGELVATQRTVDTRVVGRVTRPDGAQEDIHFPVEPGRWDHVDGRVLATPSSGREGPPTVAPAAVTSLASQQLRRGLRTGFWVGGEGLRGAPRFLDGAHLAWSRPPYRLKEDMDEVPFAVVDVASLTARTERGRPWVDPTLVRDEAGRNEVAGILGEPLELGDSVHRFEGLPHVVVSLSSFPEIARGRLLVVDPRERTVVGRPNIVPDVLFGISLGSFVHAPDVGLLFASNSSGSTLEAISTETWRVAWREPWQSGNGHPRRITLRGERVFSWGTNPEHTDVHHAKSGEPVYDGSTSPFTAIDGSDGGRWAVGATAASFALLDGREFAPLVMVWLEPSGAAHPLLTAVGVDGAFMAPERRIREAHVLLAGTFVPAVDVAPWLWDPLHVRSLTDDADRGARAVPERR